MYKEIENLITNYFEGILEGDIKGVDYIKSITEYIDGVQNRKSPKNLNESFNIKIIGINIIGKVAMVKLHVPMLKYNYYDYLSLTKLDNRCKIVNKIFSHVE